MVMVRVTDIKATSFLAEFHENQFCFCKLQVDCHPNPLQLSNDHAVAQAFTKRRQRALFEALEKIKAELMVLGFISLILTIGQNYIVRICIPLSVADTMLPCALAKESEPSEGENNRRRLLWNERRSLAGGVDSNTFSCKKGYEPLISLNGLHQLHIFIFFLAAFHVLYSAMTMMLGRLQIRGWKEWERETLSQDYDFSSDPSRFRLTHETSFVKSHSSFWTRIPVLFYVGAFFRQFFRSVRKSDYLAMRHGFISVHLSPGSKFNFQKYIKRSLEDDFKIVVGISPLLWASVVVFLLLNVAGWQALLWIAVFPLVAILGVGTKLQAIITQMALEIQERHAVVQGIPLVQVSDAHFWFGWPELVLYLIHFTLFQNAFQITYFLWIWYEFGFDSCFYGNKKVMLVRFFLGVGVQFMCSYVTLPLYALVTQMGSTMKRSIFDEQTSKALKKWHMKAVKKEGMAPTTRTLGGSPDSSPRSPGNPIQQLKTNGHSARSSTSDVQAEAAFPSTLKQDQGDGTREQRSHNQDQEMANRNKFTNANFLTDP